MLFDELKCYNSVLFKRVHSNEEVSDQNIVALIILPFILICSWRFIVILRISRPENSQNSYENNCATVPFLIKLQAI